MGKTLMCSECRSPYDESETHPCPERTQPRRIASTPEESHEDLAEVIAANSSEGVETVSFHQEIEIICGDCGKQKTHRGRCAKCGGNSWITASEWAHIVEEARKRRLAEET